MSSANAELAMYSVSTLAGSAPFSYETSANSRFSTAVARRPDAARFDPERFEAADVTGPVNRGVSVQSLGGTQCINPELKHDLWCLSDQERKA